MVGFAEKLNVQNCGNSTGNCVHYICKECLDLQKIFNIQNSKNSTGNCIHYMYGMLEFTEKLNVQNCINSTGNCVHYICMECLVSQIN